METGKVTSPAVAAGATLARIILRVVVLLMGMGMMLMAACFVGVSAWIFRSAEMRSFDHSLLFSADELAIIPAVFAVISFLAGVLVVLAGVVALLREVRG